MKSQWDCVLQNLGEWQGSFAHFSPQGLLQEDIPALLNGNMIYRGTGTSPNLR